MTLETLIMHGKTNEYSLPIFDLKPLKRRFNQAVYEVRSMPNQIIRDLNEGVFYD